MDFPSETSELIRDALLQHSKGETVELMKGSVPSKWHCINCGINMHYQGSKFVCGQCKFSIKSSLQHLMQNRVGHSDAV